MRTLAPSQAPEADICPRLPCIPPTHARRFLAYVQRYLAREQAIRAAVDKVMGRLPRPPLPPLPADPDHPNRRQRRQLALINAAILGDDDPLAEPPQQPAGQPPPEGPAAPGPAPAPAAGQAPAAAGPGPAAAPAAAAAAPAVPDLRKPVVLLAQRHAGETAEMLGRQVQQLQAPALLLQQQQHFHLQQLFQERHQQQLQQLNVLYLGPFPVLQQQLNAALHQLALANAALAQAQQAGGPVPPAIMLRQQQRLQQRQQLQAIFNARQQVMILAAQLQALQAGVAGPLPPPQLLQQQQQVQAQMAQLEAQLQAAMQQQVQQLQQQFQQQQQQQHPPLAVLQQQHFAQLQALQLAHQQQMQAITAHLNALAARHPEADFDNNTCDTDGLRSRTLSCI